MKTKRKGAFMKWLDAELARTPHLRRQVKARMNEIRLNQELAELRAERGLSQAELAKRLGVSQPAIAKLESGRVKNLQLETVVRWATALGGHIKVEVSRTSPRRKAVVGRA